MRGEAGAREGDGNRGAPRHLPLLVLLFVGSGCAALIYEVVWFQMLQLVIGATEVSLGVLLGAFMGGMCLGSLALPKYVPRERHPLAVYAALEVGIAGFGVVLLLLIPLVGGAYLAVVPVGPGSILLRALLAGLLLIPPTALMGATLPAIARYVETTPAGVSWMGFFYKGNIAGAVLGCMVAGFWLLRRHDVVVATLAAAAINVTVAGLAFALARTGGSKERPAAHENGHSIGLPGLAAGPHRTILIAIALSGFVALGSQVVWTRLMALMLGPTTYTFSIILAVFLTALGVGSGAGACVARHTERARTLFGVCQALTVVGVAWTAHAIALQLPYWPINPSIAHEPGYVFQLDLARAFWALTPAPLFWGASFPLAVAAAAERGQDPGALVGRVYAANTVGAIGGALMFGVLAIPWLGSQNAERLVVALGTLSAGLLLAPRIVGPGRAGLARPGAAAALVVAALLAWAVPAVPPVLVAYGRYAATGDPPNAIYVGEGRNASIVVSEASNGVRNLHIGGKVVASTEPYDMRLQRMLGHLTALLHDEPRSVLVVGLGAGVTAGTFVTHPGIERIVIVEIEPLVVTGSARYFADANNDVLDDPRVEVVFDDARHYLQITDESFDLITSDPIHPWMKGAAALYSEEYFELLDRHLDEGGVVTQWVPLYETTAETVKSGMATFFQAFPDATVWGNTTYEGRGYDLVMAARKHGGPIDLDRYVARLQSREYDRVAADLWEVGYRRVLDLLATYAVSASDLEPWLEGAEVNRDRSLRLMYLAGLGLNRYDQNDIYAAVLERRSPPRELFVGSPERVAALEELLRLSANQGIAR
jgi:spermidine synthase